METTFLHEFLVLEDSNSFSKAAKELGLTEATLSRHVKQFEEANGVLLFERTTREIRLTPFGESLYWHAHKILDEEHEFQLDVEKIRFQHSSHLIIGTIGFPHYYGITALLGAFKKEHSDVTLEVLVASTDELLEMLRSGKIHLAFIRNMNNVADDYPSLLFREDYVRLAIPITHPLSDLETAPLGLFKNDVFHKRFKSGSLTDRFTASVFESVGFTPKYSDNEALWEDSVIRDPHAITLCMGGLAETLQGNVHIKVLTLQPKIHADIWLASPKDATMPDVARSFMDFAREKSEKPDA